MLGLKEWRARTAHGIQGTVLELGAGSGRNAPWLKDDAVVIALDPDLELLRFQRAKGRLRGPAIVAVGEALPFRNSAFDAALATLVLCSVEDQRRVALELKRTLRVGGVLHAIDHVASSALTLERLQQRLAPSWYRMTAGCRIDRHTVDVLQAEGFEVTHRDNALKGVFIRYEAAPRTTTA
ncbi:MAG TPA: class I SAM-dependent methyltransferase [Actinomycetota bacterium]|nr:class I SAM-dependent methyltransferase [Actinomycetota bacterium]